MALSDEEMLRLLARQFDKVAEIRRAQGGFESSFYAASLVLDSIGAALEFAARELATLKEKR